ncbi:MAG: PadR family transcriptional regulator [Anaerolineae bacterium]
MSVRNALLGLLAQRPRHGYELRAAFEAVAGGRQMWRVNPAQIYTTLNRLESGGLIARQGVAQSGGPEKRIYAITPQGMAALTGWLSVPVEGRHRRDEFFLKLMLCLATAAADPYQLIYTQRASLYRELHAVTAQRSRADPSTGLARILLLDRTVMHLEADLHWLEMVEARLDDIQRQPVPEPDPRPRGRPPKQP